jgi:UPF0716 family protein affecting phage T7 exclusion
VERGRPGSLQGLTATALSIGRVLGYLEAMTLVDARSAAGASLTAQQLLSKLEQAAAALQ